MKIDNYLGQEKVWKGVWWIPGQEELKISGILTYTPGKNIILELIGGFDKDEKIPHGNGYGYTGNFLNIPVILGVVEDKYITLINNRINNQKSTFSFQGFKFQKQKLRSECILEGVHMDSVDEEMWTKCNFSLEYLSYFDTSDAVVTCYDTDKEKNFTGMGKVLLNKSSDEQYKGDSKDILLTHSNILMPPVTSSGFVYGEVYLHPYMSIIYKYPAALEKILTDIKIFQDLISFAMYSPSGVLWITAYLQIKKEEYSVNIYYIDKKVAEIESTDYNPHTTNMFTLRDVQFSKIIEKWLKAVEIYKAPLNIIMSFIYGPSDYIEKDALFIVAAAEAMHRATAVEGANKRLSKKEFKELRKNILEVVPEEHYEWISGCLRNSFTLRERLVELINFPGIKNIMQDIVSDTQEWSRIVANVRNDLAHEGFLQNDEIQKIDTAINIAKIVVIFTVLNYLDIPEQKLEKLITEHRYFSSLAHKGKEIIFLSIEESKND